MKPRSRYLRAIGTTMCAFAFIGRTRRTRGTSRLLKTGLMIRRCTNTLKPCAARLSETEGQSDADFELFVNAPVGGHQKDEGETERAKRAVISKRF